MNIKHKIAMAIDSVCASFIYALMGIGVILLFCLPFIFWLTLIAAGAFIV